MTVEMQVPQQWVYDLRDRVENILCDLYREKAEWSYNSECLALTFPTDIIIDHTKGITQALNKFAGRIEIDGDGKTFFLFQKPTETKADAIPVTMKPYTKKIEKEENSQLSQDNNIIPTKIEVKKTLSMTMEKYIEPKGNYVNVKTCKINDVFQIMEAPEFTENEYQGQTRTQLVAKVCKENSDGTQTPMLMTINQANARTFCNAFSTDPKTWVGKKVYIVTKQRYNNGNEGFILAPKY